MTIPPRNQSPTITILLPARNEEAVLATTYSRLQQMLRGTGCPWEIILIDDGSTDQTAAIWSDLQKENPRLSMISFRRNFGKETALLAGFAHAQGDVVIPVDADLQDPPELIPEFLEKWREGYDQVYGVRAHRAEGLAKRLTARLHYRLLNLLSPITIPSEAGDFRLLDRALVAELLRLPERDRYTKGLYAWVGGRACGIPYSRPSRVGGTTQQRLGTLTSLALDGITSFSSAPLRILLWMGMGSCAIAVGYVIYLLIAVYILKLYAPPGYPTSMLFILFFGGVQMAGIGLVGEYLSRIYREVKQRPAYLVQSSSAGKPAP